MGKFDTLSPLRKWVITNKYFIKTSDPKEKKVGSTHFLLDGGIWKIPQTEYLEFLKILSVDLQNNEKHYISENKTPIFKFICDLDIYELSEEFDIIPIVKVIQSIIEEYFGPKTVIICGSDTKKKNEFTKHGYHLVWPEIWINIEMAKSLRNLFIEKLIKIFEERHASNTWSEVVDLAVYEDNGLRMIGCRKIGICKDCKNKKDLKTECQVCNGSGRIDEGRVYSPKAVLPINEEFFKTIKNDIFIQLVKTSIYNYQDNPLTEVIKELPVVSKVVKKVKKQITPESDEVSIKIESFIKKHFKDTHKNIKIKKINKETDKYYIEPDDNFCINVNRNHTSSGVYFQITPDGICQRCYCKKDTTEGRFQGPCKMFSSKTVPLNKTIKTLLFGTITPPKKGKKINSYNLSRDSSTATLDLCIGNVKAKGVKQIILENCKNILFQLEKELTT